MVKTLYKNGKWLVWVIFLIYIAILFNLVFFSEAYGRLNAEILKYQKINLVPFKTIKNYIHVRNIIDPRIVITNILGNIVVFVPFGLMLPILIKFQRNMMVALVSSILFSGFIEIVQGYLGVGVLDVDDIILNALGGVIGYVLFSIGRKIFEVRK